MTYSLPVGGQRVRAMVALETGAVQEPCCLHLECTHLPPVQPVARGSCVAGNKHILLVSVYGGRVVSLVCGMCKHSRGISATPHFH